MDFDVIVLGWGKAGKSIAADLAAAGQRVALVERSASMYGGTCINVGCIPTKDLLVSAEERRSSDDVEAFFAQSVADRDKLIDALRAANYGMLDGKVALFDGHAAFTGPHTIEVRPVEGEPSEGGEVVTLTAPKIIINTGMEPFIPPIPGRELPGVYDSTTIQHANPFPKRLVIIGAGFIGLEFATMFTNFGAEVTVIDQMDAFIPRVDRDVAEMVSETLTSQGIRVDLGVSVTGIEETGDGLVVKTKQGDYATDGVLIAVGRKPATADLGLDAAGIETTDRGFVKVNERLQTNVDGVYAAGDVNGGLQFTYISYDDYRILRSELLNDGNRTLENRQVVPWTSFIEPPLSVIGMSEEEARASGRKVLVAKADIAKIPVMPRPKIVGQTAGMMKFLVDADDERILGASLYCIDSQELINLVAAVMRLGGTARDLRDGIWTHPSSTEAFNGVLKGLQPL